MVRRKRTELAMQRSSSKHIMRTAFVSLSALQPTLIIHYIHPSGLVDVLCLRSSLYTITSTTHEELQVCGYPGRHLMPNSTLQARASRGPDERHSDESLINLCHLTMRIHRLSSTRTIQDRPWTQYALIIILFSSFIHDIYRDGWKNAATG